jgi:capsular polysaccharide biosynthesis protein
MLFWCRGYYHWICDVLPRIQRALPYLPAETKFIIPEKLSRPFWDALNAVGIPIERCVEFKGRRPWIVQNLIHVPPVAMTGDHTRETVDLLRKTVFKTLGITPNQSPSRKIYISRKTGLERVLVNEAEVFEAIRPMGFEQIFCEDLTFAEQVAAFSDAGFVLGPHGGGLTNAIWCTPGDRVLEIFHPGSVRRCYWSIAQAIGLNHACGVGKEAETGALHSMKCDVRQLVKAIIM